MHRPLEKLTYFQRILRTQFTPSRFVCPSCLGTSSHVVDRKLLITQLRRCKNCRLMFRTPTDIPTVNAHYYDRKYIQGFTTNMPSDATLTEMKRINFTGTEKDYSYYIRVLTGLGLTSGARVFDYGCSWGYGSFQLVQAGFVVTAFEIAHGRRSYAQKKLGIQIVDDMNLATGEFAGQFDCFFSAHVLEHVPSPAQSLNYAMLLLKPGGIFVSFTPNGSSGFRAASSDWSKLWGEVHPNFIDDIFLDYSFKRSPRVIGSSPVTNASIPDEVTMRRLDQLARGELFFAARKSGDIWG
jgi:2-polyprenyl-3-methyl-5-hydroxy-6-metoxy-1,4-benzoquinol methylase